MNPSSLPLHHLLQQHLLHKVPYGRAIQPILLYNGFYILIEIRINVHIHHNELPPRDRNTGVFITIAVENFIYPDCLLPFMTGAALTVRRHLPGSL